MSTGQALKRQASALINAPFVIVTVTLLALVLINFVSLGINQWLARPYRDSAQAGPWSSSRQELKDIRVWIDHPRGLRFDDAGLESGKRIIITVSQTRTVPSSPIVLAIAPVSNTVRFLDYQGKETDGIFVISTTHQVARVGMPVAHPGTPSQTGTNWYASFKVRILPPTRGISVPVDLPSSIFSIKLEDSTTRFWRELTADLLKIMGPGEITLMSLAASAGQFLHGW